MSIGNEIHPVQREDDGEWEDVPDIGFTRRSSEFSDASRGTPTRFATPSSPRSTTRRRKTFTAQPPATIPRRLATKPRRKPLLDIDGEQMQEALVFSAASSVRYVGSIFTHAFQLLRWPLGILAAIWLLGIAIGRLSHTFRTVFGPVCWVPYISSSTLCQSPQVTPYVAQWADYPRLVEIQSTNFGQLFDGTAGGSALNLEIKNAEIATKDLVMLVKVSELKSRDLLIESLNSFVSDARKTGRSLQRLTSRIDGSVDRIMAVNDHALNTIEGAQAPNSLMRVMWPFGTPPNSQEAAVVAFQTSMEIHAAEMGKVLLELEVASQNLDRLEEHLDTLHELCTRENLTLSTARDALLSELWTVLGMNRARLRRYSTNLELLKDLGEYRKRAAAHVAAAMQTLQAMGEDMEDLRERVAAPEIVGDRIPVEVHMKSIRSGMERIKEQRIKAREREEQMMNKILGIEASG